MKITLTIEGKDYECVTWTPETTGIVHYEIHIGQEVYQFNTEQEAIDFGSAADVPFRMAKVEEIIR